MKDILNKIKRFFNKTYIIWVGLLLILAILLIVLFLGGNNTVC